MKAGLLGMIATPAQGNTIPPGVGWVADNGCFGGGYPGDDGYLSWLSERANDRCRFAVAPDVVADHEATLERSAPMLARIRAMVPVAFVGQNGATPDTVPWGAFDALFVGGDTAWKLGGTARGLVAEANRRGVWTHMGRVNSLARLRYAHAIGCDSVDGTYLAFGPDTNLPKLLGWLRAVAEPVLFEVTW